MYSTSGAVMVIFADTIWGVDTDEIFAYSTKKVVWIRDRWIGLFYYAVILLVLAWVIGGQILWKNEHLSRMDVKGVARIWYSHPTVRDCDPDGGPDCKSRYRKLTDINYCDVYRGPDKSPYSAHCRFRDRISLQHGASRVSSLFLPTSVEVITDEKHCEPSEENGYSCDNTYQPLSGSDCLQAGRYLCKKRNGEENQFYYVADVLNYRVSLASSYERENIRGMSLQHQGFVGVCRGLVDMSHHRQTWTDRQKALAKYRCTDDQLEIEKIPCAQGVSCAAMRAFDILEETGISVAGRTVKDGLHRAIKGNKSEGDEKKDKDEASFMTVGSGHHSRRLRARRNQGKSLGTDNEPGRPHLEDFATTRKPGQPGLDGVEALEEYSNHWGDVFTIRRLLTLAGADLDQDYNMDGWTARQSGTVLEVTAVYNNLYPFLSAFGYRPVSYHYTVRQLALPYVSQLVMSEEQPDDYPKHRRHELQYGLLIYFKVGGSFGFFNLVYLLVMITTALALTGSAAVVTDLVGIYLHPKKDNFFHLKYEVSPDFSDAWKCTKCGYYNHQYEETCLGAPAFVDKGETGICGARRPAETAVEQ